MQWKHIQRSEIRGCAGCSTASPRSNNARSIVIISVISKELSLQYFNLLPFLVLMYHVSTSCNFHFYFFLFSYPGLLIPYSFKQNFAGRQLDFNYGSASSLKYVSLLEKPIGWVGAEDSFCSVGFLFSRSVLLFRSPRLTNLFLFFSEKAAGLWIDVFEEALWVDGSKVLLLFTLFAINFLYRDRCVELLPGQIKSK